MVRLPSNRTTVGRLLLFVVLGWLPRRRWLARSLLLPRPILRAVSLVPRSGLRCLSELSVECLVGTFFIFDRYGAWVEMVVLLGICLSSQKPGTRSRYLRVGIDSSPSARHILSNPSPRTCPI